MGLIITDNATASTVGTHATDFILKDEKHMDWQLSKNLGRVIALLFYPADETIVCTKQLCSLRDHWAEYLETKAVIVGISPGTTESHRSFAERHRLPLSLLADVDGDVTKQYNKHWWMPSRLTRALVVIDAKGIIRYRKVMLRAFRPTDKSTIAAIYLAQYDNLSEQYKLKKK